jgi:hypothetical protein
MMGPEAAVMGYVSKSCDFSKKEILMADISDPKTIFSNFFSEFPKKAILIG